MTTRLQRNAEWLFATVVLGLAGWLLHSYLAALAWAAVIAIASWPLYQRFSHVFAPGRRARWAAPAFTLLVSVLFVVPMAYALFRVGREAHLLAHGLSQAQRSGVAAPVWVGNLPVVGAWLLDKWTTVLGTPGGLSDWADNLEPGSMLGWARMFGAQALHRVVILGFTLLTLFFLYRDGTHLAAQIVSVMRRGLGPRGERDARNVVSAVRATVNGLLLVGLGEGVLLGIAYELAGLHSIFLWAALTGLLAMIPFAAPLVFGVAALVLFAQGSLTAAVLVFAWGALVLFVADHFVRPTLIGGGAKLPFLWVLLGIFGGLETFKLIGLFLGPVIVAMGMSLWRDATEEPDVTAEI